MSIELVSNGKNIGYKTLFMRDAIKHTKLIITQSADSQSSYTLHYQLRVEQSSEELEREKPLILKRTNSINDEPEHLGTQQGKLEILKMGVLMYNFANRMDPTMKFHRNIINLFSWDNPTLTFLFGVAVTFMIAYPKLSVAILGLFLIFGRHFIINKAAEYEVKEDLSKRLLLPPQNMVFLQNNMQGYCDLFEKVNSFLRSEDKSAMIMLVNLACKLGAIILLLSIFFSLETLMIIGLWTTLLLLSPARKGLFKAIKPKVVQINDKIDDLLKKVSSYQVVFKILQKSEKEAVQIIKEFYIYEHQRWWVGRQWVPTHWSNEDRELHLLARK